MVDVFTNPKFDRLDDAVDLDELFGQDAPFDPGEVDNDPPPPEEEAAKEEASKNAWQYFFGDDTSTDDAPLTQAEQDAWNGIRPPPLHDEPPPYEAPPEGPGMGDVGTDDDVDPFGLKDPVLDFAPYAFPDPAKIPPREWLYGKHYIRGAVSSSIGAPGRAKSTTSLTEIMSMAVGRDLMTGEVLPCGPLRAAYLNGEETQDELDRRVAAICQLFGITSDDCGDRLIVQSTRDRPIKVAEPGKHGSATINEDAVTGLKNWCDRRKVDVLAVDPLISFHQVRETDNGDMDTVCKAAFGVIAGKDRAVDLVHHPRKLAPGESSTTVDDARGASSILGAVRVARTLNFMTKAEASQLFVNEDDRRLHIRIENGKSNPGPIGKASWLKIKVENLANGDAVACVERWVPPKPFDGVSVSDLKVVCKVVQGGAFRTDSQSPEWLGWWMVENLPGLDIKTRHSDKPRDKAEVGRLQKILKTWVENGVLKTIDGKDEKHRPKKFYAIGEPKETAPAPDIEVEDEE